MIKMQIIRRITRGLGALTLFGCVIVLASTARAHDPGLSTATVRLTQEKIEAVLVFSARDTATLLDINMDRNRDVSKQEASARPAELQKIADQALAVELNRIPTKAAEARCHFDQNDNVSIYLNYPFQTCSNLVVRSAWLKQFPPGHRQFLSLENPTGGVIAERMLTSDSDSITIQMDARQPTSVVRRNSFADFLVLGVKHIWTGYDHLLFLFGLLIVTRNFVSSFKIITCFTIAHSVTLAVATLSLVQISSRIVEPLIAASIVYVGVENLLRGDDPKGRWLLTSAFGLIHGFGFASVLKELGVGANGSGITIPLISFNLGVELGQIVVAGLALPVIWKLRTNPVFIHRWVPACSLGVVLVGGFLFVQRVWFAT
jgi:hydrogenase/urease accessory protein HupE